MCVCVWKSIVGCAFADQPVGPEDSAARLPQGNLPPPEIRVGFMSYEYEFGLTLTFLCNPPRQAWQGFKKNFTGAPK
eukprot:m.349878 g.349878  ORF g.349878 m.349878 type:complete len:77 (+) comp27957_c0_seq6:1068-1298(+)